MKKRDEERRDDEERSNLYRTVQSIEQDPVNTLNYPNFEVSIIQLKVNWLLSVISIS